MSLQERIRNFDSKIGTNGLSIFIGIVFLTGGLTSFFLNPTGFLSDQTTLFGSYGAIPVSKIISSLIGWTLLVYGILNQINFSGFEKRNNLINRLPFRKKISPKNTIFIISSFLFITIITSIFLTIRPDEKIKARNDKFNNQVKEINELMEKLQKEDEIRRIENSKKQNNS